MKQRILIANFLFFLLALASSAAAAEEAAGTKSDDSDKAKQGKAIFEKIKSLAGEWEHKDYKGNVALSVRVIAGGSAIVQREFPGTPMEMMTVYHLDGDDVMLNHFCVLGNQPRLKATMKDQTDTIVFSFVSATNLASINDPHMHEGRIRFVDKDTIKSTWTKFVDGKAAEEHTFEMIRRKSERKPDKARRPE